MQACTRKPTVSVPLSLAPGTSSLPEHGQPRGSWARARVSSSERASKGRFRGLWDGGSGRNYQRSPESLLFHFPSSQLPANLTSLHSLAHLWEGGNSRPIPSLPRRRGLSMSTAYWYPIFCEPPRSCGSLGPVGLYGACVRCTNK